MAIKIYNTNTFEEIAFLCDDIWELSDQINQLEQWLILNEKLISKGDYVADIGFSCRPNSTGGGGVINLNSMRILTQLGMEIHLSEYSNSK